MAADLAVIVTARNEADRLGATLRALPPGEVWVADDASEDATAAIAREALKRGTGARGLRAILEDVMLDVMYDLPSIPGLTECVITRDAILGIERPILVTERKAESA